MSRRAIQLAVLAVAGFGLGAALTTWLGYDALAVIVLACGTAFSWLIARTTLPFDRRPLVPSLAVQGGHIIWLLQGVITLGRWGGLFDVVPHAAGVVWLALRPGSAPAWFLAIFHAVEATLHVLQLGGTADPASAAPWVAAHVALRALAVYLMLRGLRRMQRRSGRTAGMVATAARRG